MSKKQRQKRQLKKQNSDKNKRKQAKKERYRRGGSGNLEKKKEKTRQRMLTERESKGVSPACPLEHYDKPSTEKCKGCTLKCSFKTQ